MSFVVEEDPAAVRLHQPHYGIKAGGLSGSIGTEQANHFPAMHVEAETSWTRPACRRIWRSRRDLSQLRRVTWRVSLGANSRRSRSSVDDLFPPPQRAAVQPACGTSEMAG